MKRGSITVTVWAGVCVCAAGLLDVAPAAAHHSAAQFDDTRCESISGRVRNLQWQYPHTWLWIVVPDAAGAEVIWAFEMPAPSALTRSPDWSRAALQKGETVTVHFAPTRNGQKAGLANAIRKADGKMLHAAPNAFACEQQVWPPEQQVR